MIETWKQKRMVLKRGDYFATMTAATLINTAVGHSKYAVIDKRTRNQTTMIDGDLSVTPNVQS
jgi:hypothetical protein